MKLTGLKLAEPLKAPCASGLDAIEPLVRPVFVSDLHLSGRNKKTILSFLWFLKTRARRYAELFLLGDIFEYWIGDDACSPAEFLARALSSYAAGGRRVYMMQGNRDFMLGEDSPATAALNSSSTALSCKPAAAAFCSPTATSGARSTRPIRNFADKCTTRPFSCRRCA